MLGHSDRIATALGLRIAAVVYRRVVAGRVPTGSVEFRSGLHPAVRPAFKGRPHFVDDVERGE